MIEGLLPDLALLLKSREIAVSALAGPEAARWLYGPMDGNARWRTALHEGAHAVVGLELNRGVTSASIVPDDISNGRVEHSTKPKDPQEAEWERRPENRRFRTDRRRAIAVLNLALADPGWRVLRREVRRCLWDARRLVRHVHHYEIVAVARALLECSELQASEIQGIVRNARIEHREAWRAIEAELAAAPRPPAIGIDHSQDF